MAVKRFNGFDDIRRKYGPKPRKPQPRKGIVEKPINDEVLIAGCKLHATKKELAGILGVSVTWMTKHVERKYGISWEEFYDQHSADGKVSLRRASFRLAETNAQMNIHLRKIHLGDEEVQTIKHDVNSPMTQDMLDQIQIKLGLKDSDKQ